MNSLFRPQYFTLFLSGAVLVVIIAGVVVYLLQKAFSRRSNSEEPKTATVRVENEAAFTLATVEAVITQLKAEQTALREKLIVAECRGDESTRRFELVAREIECGLIIFDARGFISFSNPVARKILAVDTWARRRYAEIFSEIPAMSEPIAYSFETGTEVRKILVEFQGPDGNHRGVQLSVLPTHDRFGAMESVSCLIRQMPAAPHA